MGDSFFISYSNADGKKFARKLADDLLDIPPSVSVWLDERELKSGIDWDEQIVEALKTCAGFLYVMTPDSVQAKSECKREWTRALRYKKPVIPLSFDADAEMPYRLEPRQYIDFSGNYEAALAKLRTRIQWQSSPEGRLQALKDRLADAERDFARSQTDADRTRVENDIALLNKEIATQEEAIAQPEKVKQQTSDRIESALERERQPTEPVQAKTTTKFINPPPATAPSWFQNRFVETKLIADFIKDDSLRLMTVVGRGGVGKTAMVCRVLKALESGQLPDDLGVLTVNGIVYLSPKGLRQVNLPHLYTDLCKLLPAETSKALESTYQSPQTSTRAKMQALLSAFPKGKVVVLLDNFETVTDAESGELEDAEFSESLTALLELPNHGVKVIITTRVAPQSLQLAQPGCQRLLRLDEGLESPHAENILREMDADGSLGLKAALPELLDEARQRTLGYPRALEALAAILSVDRTRSLSQLLTDAEKLLPDNVVEALVGEAFSSIDAAFQQVMQALAILGKPVPAGAVDFLLQPYLPGINSEPLLRALVNRLFVRSEAGKYHLHEVDRSYALQRLPEGARAERSSAERDNKLTPFSRLSLLHRAAEYYQTIRTPRESWKTIEDLAPQLAEIEVRIASGEYDAAASVLLDIDFNYLLLWGHVRLLASLHKQLQACLTDKHLRLSSFNNLGLCHHGLGEYERAIDLHNQDLAIAQEIGNRAGEAMSLGNLGSCYASLGEYERAIDFHNQSLAIKQEIGNRAGEAMSLGNLGICYDNLGEYERAIGLINQCREIAQEIGNRYGEVNSLTYLGDIYKNNKELPRAFEHYKKAITLADESGNRQNQHEPRFGLAEAHLFQNELNAAHSAINATREYDYPENNAAAWVLTGIIRVRLKDVDRAKEAFEQGREDADKLLKMCEQNLSALETKALSLCGLALCDNQKHLTMAKQAFQAARNITQAKGVITRLLNRFDALALADTENILAPLSKVAAGE